MKGFKTVEVEVYWSTVHAGGQITLTVSERKETMIIRINSYYWKIPVQKGNRK